MTIGNYVQLMILTFFQMAGHQPIVMMGGATGRVGDPSGKDKERQFLDVDLLDQNLNAQISQVEKIFSNSDGPEPIIVNNYDFYKDMSALDYLRDLGKNLTINYMLSKESVKSRLDSGMSYTEFSYQVLQGYDFLVLYRKYGCALQMGGSDQWGNITSGTEFIRRSEPEAKAYAITTPLLTKSDGSKFGKSEGGNIWLDPAMTSPYQFFQFWVNSDDGDLKKFYRYFSVKSKEEILSLEKEFDTDPNHLKRVLAEEITTRVHSKKAYDNARNVSELLFGRGIDAETIKSFDADTLHDVAQEIPNFNVGGILDSTGMPLVDLLTQNTSIFSSKSEAIRAIKGNALSLNKSKVADKDLVITSEDRLNGGFLFVENGKKNKFILKV
jgi:tyrosyl-tRNA synthetase